MFHNIELKIYYTLILLGILIINALLIIGDKILIYVIVGIFVLFSLIIVFVKWKKYFKEIFVFSLIFGQNFLYHIDVPITIAISILLIFFYFTYKIDSKIFNSNSLPKFFRTTIIFLLISILCSGVFSQFYSFYTTINALFFFTCVASGYIIFKSVEDSENIKKLLYVFIILTFIGAITKFIGIMLWGMIRGAGISGYYYMEYAPLALLTIFFLYFISERRNLFLIIASILILVAMIIDQSRFAWIGFTIAFIYGCLIFYNKSDKFRVFLKNKSFSIIITILLIISLVFILKLDKIIVSRISNISFNLFEQDTGTDNGDILNNSLESRVLIWITALNAFTHNVFTGVGFKQFSYISEQYNVLPEFLFLLYVKGLDAHTTFLNYLVETGLFGFLSFLTYMISSFVYSLKSIKLSTPRYLNLSITLNVLLFYLIVDSIYSGNFTMGPSAYLIHLIVFLNMANFIFCKKINSKNSAT